MLVHNTHSVWVLHSVITPHFKGLVFKYEEFMAGFVEFPDDKATLQLNVHQ